LKLLPIKPALFSKHVEKEISDTMLSELSMLHISPATAFFRIPLMDDP
jgi:hypothetical protein